MQVNKKATIRSTSTTVWWKIAAERKKVWNFFRKFENVRYFKIFAKFPTILFPLFIKLNLIITYFWAS